MKKLNKFIALLLAVSICLSLMNMRVFAVDGKNPGEITAPSTEDVNAGAAEQPDQTQIEEPEPILLRELEQAANDDADTTDNVPVTDDADTIGGVNDVDNIGHAENAEEEPWEMPAFSDSKTSANGVKVSVSADEGIFPAGTLLRVTDVSAYTALAAAEQALDAEVVDAVGVDISFLDADGQEIEPANKQLVNVNIRLPQALDGDEFTVIHKDDAGVVTQLLEADAAERTASFDAGEFSLYVVVGTENGVVRRTVNFYDGETLVATQIVKNGDTLLELSPALFPFGLFSFLLGHIFYVTAFLTPRTGAISVLSFPTFSRAVFPLILLLILVVYGVLMVRCLLFLPETKKLRVPLMLYLVMLIVLLLSAGLYLNAGRNLGGLLCFLGAALFVISDSILAFHLFTDRPDSGVMETYTSAQLLLVLGLLLP